VAAPAGALAYSAAMNSAEGLPAGSPSAPSAPYAPRRAARSLFVPVRGLGYHVHAWGDLAAATPERPPLVLLHGWMDVGASFQFLVDALAAAEGFERAVLAPDWRGFGLTAAPGVDSYWFPDYLGDLDALLDALLDPLVPGQPIDLVGHSMGGNVVMSYAGVRPQRIRRLVNLEGFGLPRMEPRHAPRRLAQWLDALKEPQSLRDYGSLDEVAARLVKNNPRLAADKARWLAPHWSQPDGHGRWRILGDAAHKRPNPMIYRVDEVLETWKLITAPLLWVEGDSTDMRQWWGERYSAAEFHERLDVVAKVERHRLVDCGHMLHHDQPEALAARMAAFLHG
jgi:pimeloyl-ACP methyl ester carboxylesterase